MNEKILQYIWNYKIFKNFDFKDTEGNPVEILDFGTWNHDSGPDFSLAKIKLNEITLIGNIEIHCKTSDWLLHNHSENQAYNNVILHVVYENDADLPELAKRNIPTLELKNYIHESTLQKHQYLLNENQFVACEKLFSPEQIPFFFCEKTLMKKLDEKSIEIERNLARFQNDYEAVLFHYICYAFGLKINAEIFKQMAESIDFSIIKKLSQNNTQLEALFFGMADWLGNPKDEHSKIWKREFDFLCAKFQLHNERFQPKFLRLRPPNFPTIRLSQLANLYHQNPKLFSKIIEAKNLEELQLIFRNIKASEYWNTHFNFGKISPSDYEKTLSESFVQLLIINSILPVKYTYHKYNSEAITEEILEFYKQIPPEENTITKGWKSLKLKLNNAMETQAFIYQYKNFCKEKKCLNCDIGLKLLKTV